jgi:hypothetical protein
MSPHVDPGALHVEPGAPGGETMPVLVTRSARQRETMSHHVGTISLGVETMTFCIMPGSTRAGDKRFPER